MSFKRKTCNHFYFTHLVSLLHKSFYGFYLCNTFMKYSIFTFLTLVQIFVHFHKTYILVTYMSIVTFSFISLVIVRFGPELVRKS